MKRVILKFFTAFFVLFAVLSCKDKFTEEDLLSQQQLIDLAIYVVDYTDENEPPIANAKVVVSQGNASREVTTDENGVAVFDDIKLGGYTYRIDAENYTPAYGNSEATTSNFRQNQYTERFGLYSLTSDNLATVKGTIEIEKDVTNDDTEYASGIEILFEVDLSNGNQIFTTTTDDNGNYEIKIPVNSGGSHVDISYPDFEFDQTVAYNEETEEAYYDELKPMLGQKKVLFSRSTSGAQNYSLSTSVRTVVATVEAPPTDGEQAYISTVYVNDDGEITGVSFSDGGDYDGATDDEVTITFHSILGGSGATLTIDVSNFSNLSTAYSNDDFTLEGGSGYPVDKYLNQHGYHSPSFDTGETLYPGKIRYINGDYGTGVYRTEDLSID